MTIMILLTIGFTALALTLLVVSLCWAQKRMEPKPEPEPDIVVECVGGKKPRREFTPGTCPGCGEMDVYLWADGKANQRWHRCIALLGDADRDVTQEDIDALDEHVASVIPFGDKTYSIPLQHQPGARKLCARCRSDMDACACPPREIPRWCPTCQATALLEECLTCGGVTEPREVA